ncbi:MAG: HAMP domain-containing sensor histidine kinase [Bacteroidales bacterium]|nr:HAMP domain-containing sensor histidine kinase [Bacteroidales bacterium]
MSVYTTKSKWKWGIVLAIIVVIAAFLWYINHLVTKFATEEQKNLIIWADAIKHRAELVESTEVFFDKLQEEERAKVEILAQATRMLVSSENKDDLSFYLSIVSNNTTIPVIQTDRKNNIIYANNVDFDIDTVPVLQGELKKEFSVYDPVVVSSYGVVNLLYYKDSKHFTQLREYLDSLITDFFAETVINSASVPVIITDSTMQHIVATGNIPQSLRSDTTALLKAITSMDAIGSPIELSLVDNKNYIFYSESSIIKSLKLFPLIALTIFIMFFIISYFLFSTARRSEQNQVWAGLAKETAHQLGTPLSSMMAWIELLKMKDETEIAEEMNKDIIRLDTITKRFSKIGSAITLEPANIAATVENSINYLKKRTSDKVIFTINAPDEMMEIPLCIDLFEWVIENLCKNAVDAMNGHGSVTINISQDAKNTVIDVADTGKGIPRSKQKSIFNPGITSKTRGWGLGLSLAKRIVEDMHHGKIFVKSSTLNKGTVFRIILKNR